MKVTTQFDAVPNGEIYPVTYMPGDECPPELEATARYYAGQAGEVDPDANGDGKLTVDEIRSTLTAKGIAFDPKAKKADLLALLPKD
ncbi:HeH/LEM domain-containing protein [Acidovorax sp. Root217]|uniref:HeH/LEM domain-containing protein n=1 Tax=Acidovorax sp. Root217 TaxID=1736492 RepID=UPI0007096270|nr:HeH/LEM domain-containing protein [Acidovorax sp. Root217]